MSDMFVDSLRNRIRAMNTLWERAISDMTLEHVNHHERAGVLPIAFSLSHYIRAQDQSVSARVPARADAVESRRLGGAGRRRRSTARARGDGRGDGAAPLPRPRRLERVPGRGDRAHRGRARYADGRRARARCCCRSCRRTCSRSSARWSSAPARRCASSMCSSASSTSTACGTWARSSTAAPSSASGDDELTEHCVSP